LLQPWIHGDSLGIANPNRRASTSPPQSRSNGSGERNAGFNVGASHGFRLSSATRKLLRNLGQRHREPLEVSGAQRVGASGGWGWLGDLLGRLCGGLGAVEWRSTRCKCGSLGPRWGTPVGALPRRNPCDTHGQTRDLGKRVCFCWRHARFCRESEQGWGTAAAARNPPCRGAWRGVGLLGGPLVSTADPAPAVLSHGADDEQRQRGQTPCRSSPSAPTAWWLPPANRGRSVS
jgi:hypothetical protein